MKIVFIAITGENLACESLTSFLERNGHQAEIVFDPRLFDSGIFNSEKLAKYFDITTEIVREVLSKRPDIIGFPVFTTNYQRALTLAREIKKLSPTTPVIFGGIHPTSVPDVVIKEDCVDYVCIGEGEYALKELMDDLKNKIRRTDIKNIWFKNGKKTIVNSTRPLLMNLDNLPFPDKSTFLNNQPRFIRNEYYTISSRGCPFACTFCANNVLHKIYDNLSRHVRRRSPINVIDELVTAKKLYKIKKVTFPNDIFVQDIRWLEDFVKMYKRKVKLPYTVLTHATFLTYPIAKLLANSGCFMVGFGIQSASEKTRREVLGRPESNQQIRMAAENCRKAGLRFCIDHIFNLPGEGLTEMEEALNFYNELRPTYINCFYLQYFPRTGIIRHGIEKKMISKEMIPDIERGLAPSEYFFALGKRDSRKRNQMLGNIQLMFNFLPIAPSWMMGKIIAKKWYMSSFKPPLLLIGLVKFFNVLKNGTAYVYFDTLKYYSYFSLKIFLMKRKYRRLVI